jgi:hypothetical protein
MTDWWQAIDTFRKAGGLRTNVCDAQFPSCPIGRAALRWRPVSVRGFVRRRDGDNFGYWVGATRS